MSHPKIGFIGAGNMATSIVGGLIAQGVSSQNIWLNDINIEHLQQVSGKFNTQHSASYKDFINLCDVVVLAVKPQNMAEVCSDLASNLKGTAPLFISIAAGITVERLTSWLGNVPIVRVMPNTPALVQTGASGLFASVQVTDEQKVLASNLLNSVGITVWLEQEGLMDAVTAVSGSGPAYFFLLMEQMIASGVDLGLPEATARDLVLQTALGAATLAANSEDSPSVLREKVTSPGGTTAAALNTFADGNFNELVKKALTAAKQRSEELA